MEGIKLGKKVYTSRYTDACIYGGKAIGTIRFTNGRYVTDDPRRQQVIENSRWFKLNHIIIENEDEVAQVQKAVTKVEEPDQVKDKQPQESDGNDVAGVFTCELCSAEFGSANALNGHMISHRRKGEI